MKILGIVSLFLILLITIGVNQPTFAQSAQVTATVRPNPLEVEILAPSSVTVGQSFTINAQVSNLGALRINRVVATLNTPTEISVKGSKSKGLGKLAAGETKTINWQAKATQSGNFIVQVETQGFLDGELISASDSTVINASNSAIAAFWRLLIFGS